MKQYLYDLVQQVEALNTAQLAIHIIMAVLLGFVIYVSDDEAAGLIKPL